MREGESLEPRRRRRVDRAPPGGGEYAALSGGDKPTHVGEEIPHNCPL